MRRKEKDNSQELFNALLAMSEEIKIDLQQFAHFLENAIESAYKKQDKNVKYCQIFVNLVPEKQILKIYRVQDVVATLEDIVEEPDFDNKIILEEAKEFDPNAEVGGKIYHEIDIKKWSAIAIHQVKQVLMQNINSFKKDLVRDRMSSKENEIVKVTVTREERGNVYVEFRDTKMVAGVMTYRDQIKGEHYYPGQEIKVLVKGIKNDDKGNLSVVEVSRSAPEFVEKLFRQEVLEIEHGLIIIKGVARNAGTRTKIAVQNNTGDYNFDPIAACIGDNSSRVNAVVQEINGEKIDIILYDSDISRYIAAALSPAQVIRISVNESLKEAKVVVPDDKFSLAIGKGGNNVVLASRLTGWKISILKNSESDIF